MNLRASAVAVALVAAAGCGGKVVGPASIAPDADSGVHDAAAPIPRDAGAGVCPGGVQVPSRGECTSDGWCLTNPVPQGGDLYGAFGSGPTDLWLVGVGGTILHGDGRDWSLTDLVGSALRGGWAASPCDAWAVGDNGAIARWDGTGWNASAVATVSLAAAWGASASDVWAVGSYGTALHWSGSAWSVIATGSADDLAGVWGSSGADAWAVGGAGAILHWDGSAWSPSSGGTGTQLDAVWGAAAMHALKPRDRGGGRVRRVRVPRGQGRKRATRTGTRKLFHLGASSTET